jgi:hypothetical protein
MWPEGIDLDPSTNAGSIVGATVEYDLDKGLDGLDMPWGHLADRGVTEAIRHGTKDGGGNWPSVAVPDLDGPIRTWINPPFSDAGPWIRRAWTEARNGWIEALAITHVATSTSWWQRYVWGSAAVCFLYRRPSFLGDDGKPAKGNRYDCAIHYYGSETWRFGETSKMSRSSKGSIAGAILNRYP